MRVNMTERDILERIGISNGEGTKYPELTINGKRFNTNQIRRKVPIVPNVQHDYWYSVPNVSYKASEDELKPLIEYVNKQVNGSKRVIAPSKVKSDDAS